MQVTAVIFEQPGRLRLGGVMTSAPAAGDVVVEVDFSGISTGTERLLWSGRMPPFPGLGYPLVPGYESVGRIVSAGESAKHRVGECVFVPGTSRYQDVKGLFGGSASRIVADDARVVSIPDTLGQQGTLLALAATACHVLAGSNGATPDLIVGHGVLGRLLARIAIAAGGPAPVVWESREQRRCGAEGYTVIAPEDDPRRDYRMIVDMSGDAAILDTLVMRSARGGEIVLAGFYEDRLSFGYVPAFLREARIRVSAEWAPPDLEMARDLVVAGRLSLDGLVTDTRPADRADEAYPIAFTDPDCLKMTLDWRMLQ